MVGDSFLELRGEIGGPPDTPYEGGRFELEIKIPDSYPFNPPKVLHIRTIFSPFSFVRSLSRPVLVAPLPG